MRSTLPIRWGAVAALAAGMLVAQTPAPQPEPGAGRAWKQGRMRGPMAGRMGMQSRLWAEALDLTEGQKAQAKTIFDEARAAAKPLHNQMSETRKALREAVRTHQTAEIDRLAADQGALTGKLIAIRAKAQEKFRSLLTAAQQEKLDSLRPGRRRGPQGV